MTYLEWQKAKHGYIHRDIKPENIMIARGRGPVLIDFNISVRSGSPVLTTSATSGYLPEINVTWNAATDIYALGVTMLELAAGNRLFTSSIEELLEQASARHGEKVCSIITEMLNAPKNDMGARELRRFALRNKPDLTQI